VGPVLNASPVMAGLVGAIHVFGAPRKPLAGALVRNRLHPSVRPRTTGDPGAERAVLAKDGVPACAGTNGGRRRTRKPYALAALLLMLLPDPANAAALDGSKLSWPWALPFVGLLLTLAAV